MDSEKVRIKEALKAATELNKTFWDKVKELADKAEFGPDEILMVITMVYAKMTEALLGMAKDTNSMHTFSNLLSIKDLILREINTLNSSTLKEIEDIYKTLPNDNSKGQQRGEVSGLSVFQE